MGIILCRRTAVQVASALCVSTISISAAAVTLPPREQPYNYEGSSLVVSDSDDRMPVDFYSVTIAPNIAGVVSRRSPVTIPQFAFKTNLLFWAAGIPNVGFELPIGKKFSAAATFAYAYWQIKNTYALQTVQESLALKYWFNPLQRPLTGWNAGVYVLGGGRYDVQWRKGWQGDMFLSAGPCFGYAWPVGKNFNLELAAAAGWFYTPEARHYAPGKDGLLMWDRTHYNVGRFSLTKLQVNLMWMIGKQHDR